MIIEVVIRVMSSDGLSGELFILLSSLASFINIMIRRTLPLGISPNDCPAVFLARPSADASSICRW